MCYSWSRCDDPIRKQIQLQSDGLKDVLKNPDDLQSEHILPDVISDFENSRLPHFGTQTPRIPDLKTERIKIPKGNKLTAPSLRKCPLRSSRVPVCRIGRL